MGCDDVIVVVSEVSQNHASNFQKIMVDATRLCKPLPRNTLDMRALYSGQQRGTGCFRTRVKKSNLFCMSRVGSAFPVRALISHPKVNIVGIPFHLPDLSNP